MKNITQKLIFNTSLLIYISYRKPKSDIFALIFFPSSFTLLFQSCKHNNQYISILLIKYLIIVCDVSKYKGETGYTNITEEEFYPTLTVNVLS